MKNIFSTISNILKGKKLKKVSEEDLICALRLSYNNFDEKPLKDINKLYSECLSKSK